MFSSGMNAATARLNAKTAQSQEGRQQRQQDLTAKMANYEVGPDGAYVPNDIRKAQEGVEKTKIDILQEQLNATTQALQAQQQKAHADGITNILSNITSGNWQDAYNDWKKTPGLKETLSKSKALNASDISPLNFDDPNDVLMLSDVGVDQTKLEDKSYRQALQKSFMRIQGNDGSWRVMPVDQVIKSTNTYSMMSKQQQEMYNTNAREVNAILQGKNPALVGDQDQKDTIMREAIALKDPAKSLEALQITDPELFAKATAGSGRRDELEQYTTAFFDAHKGETPEVIVPKFKEAMKNWILRKDQGTKAVKEASDNQVVVETATTPKPSETKFDENKAIETEQKTLTSLKGTNSKEYDRVQADITVMKDNHNLATNIDKIAKGTGKKIDLDAISSVKDKLSKWFGYEDDQTLTNAVFQTQSGMLLADYILSRSGTAASDTERSFLTGLMTSGNFDDEVYVRNAMKAFSSQLREKNKTMSSNVEKYAPASAHKYTQSPKPSREEMIQFLKDNQS